MNSNHHNLTNKPSLKNRSIKNKSTLSPSQTSQKRESKMDQINRNLELMSSTQKEKIKYSWLKMILKNNSSVVKATLVGSKKMSCNQKLRLDWSKSKLKVV